MRPPRRITLEGGEVDAREEEFEIVREGWNEYRLLDGGVVRVKTTATRIFRVLREDGTPAVDGEGDPHIVVRHSTQVEASNR